MTKPVVLECDLGNTRCKWRVVCAGEVLQHGSFTHQQPSADFLGLSNIQRIRIASVAKADTLQQFIDRLAPLNVDCEIAKTSSQVGAVINAYSDPSRLGVDRWLAILAAYNKVSGAVLILDAGSALTADLVDHAGVHLGGYILPGLRLMQQSLLSDTGSVRFDANRPFSGVGFGESTLDAVQAGILSAQIGSILVAIDEAKRRIRRDFAILLTGGDAALLSDHLPGGLSEQIGLAPELVLDGLQWALP